MVPWPSVQETANSPQAPNADNEPSPERNGEAMSGESKRSDDPDFLDDDFVIEDLTGKQEDLEQLFTTPKAPVQQVPGAPPDSDDLLFTDHTKGLQPSENFSSNRSFAEDAPSQWSADGLELESVGVPPAEAEAAAAHAGGDIDPELRKAEADFTAELGSLLQSEEEFGLDSEQELELVGGATGGGTDEFEQSGPFVLDDSDGAWQQDGGVPAEVGTDAGAESVEADAEQAPPASDDDVLEPVLAAADAEPVAEGWEPLPSTNVDQLAEVGGVERSDESAEAAEPALVGAAATAEGHDIYTEQPGQVLVGPRRNRGQRRAVWIPLAASLALIGGTAAVVLRPEWFGLAIQPERVEQVQVARPAVKVTVPQPSPIGTPQVAVTGPTKPTPPTPTTEPKPPSTTASQGTPPSVATGPQRVPTGPDKAPVVPDPSNPDQPATGTVNPVVVDPVATAPDQPDPNPSPVVTTPVATTTSPTDPEPGTAAVLPVVEVPAGSSQPTGWPVAQRNPTAQSSTPKGSSPLVRIGDDLMVGEIGPAGKPSNVVEGVLPGSRAFAQLNNGNYFIGQVKFADANRVTLRVDEGEVTLATAELSRFTALGSSDYDELQKATSGFVRLTNNNRLVGGILSRIADDHIVLEFRSNRVMLPKSAVGEVVRGEDDAGIRLDVTREEDDWVKQMVERQLGTGVNPAETKPGTLPKPAPPQSEPPAPSADPVRPAAPGGNRR